MTPSKASLDAMRCSGLDDQGVPAKRVEMAAAVADRLIAEAVAAERERILERLEQMPVVRENAEIHYTVCAIVTTIGGAPDA